MPRSAPSNVSPKIEERVPGKDRMLRIRRSANGEVVFTLSGEMDEEATTELKTIISSESNGRPIALDLKDMTLVDENAIAFFVSCEANSITLKNCPAYVREWINAERRES
jgi:ABC-type transporter Mla MlaB component